MQQRIRNDQPLQEILERQRRPLARALGYYAQRYSSRDRAIAEAYRSGAYSMQEIGAYFRVGRMTVSRAVKKYESLLIVAKVLGVKPLHHHSILT